MPLSSPGSTSRIISSASFQKGTRDCNPVASASSDSHQLTCQVEVVLDEVLVDLAEVVVTGNVGREPGLITVSHHCRSLSLTIQGRESVSSDEPSEGESNLSAAVRANRWKPLRLTQLKLILVALRQVLARHVVVLVRHVAS